MTTQPTRTGKAAKIETVDSPLAFRDQEFAAKMQGRRDTVKASVEGESQGATQGGTVTVTRPSMVTMYKMTPEGWRPRWVHATAVTQNLQNGWKSYCPDCGGQHDPNGSPNDCPRRTPLMRRICPVCGCDIWDTPNSINGVPVEDFEAEDDDTIIRDDTFKQSTPESRTKAGLEMHLWYKHPAETRGMGIAPLSEPPPSILESLARVSAV